MFKNQRAVRVWLPPGFDRAAKHPVLYILDGASAFDACTAFRHEELSADETLTSLIQARKIPPVIAVGIDNGSDVGGNIDQGAGRASEFLPYATAYFPLPFTPRGASFPAFLENDVMPAIAKRYAVQPGPDGAAIWGASYGGVAAIHTIVERPELFSAAIVESPSVEVGNGQLLRDTQSLLRAPKRIAIGVGTTEETGLDADAINAGIVKAVRQLAGNFSAAISPADVRLTVADKGTHDTPAFGRRLADALTFIYAAREK